MANYYTQYSFEITDLMPQEETWLTKRLELEIDEDYFSVLPCYAFENGNGDSRILWFHDDEGDSDLEAFAELLQDFLAEFRPSSFIGFSRADTCSKSILDSFGGGAVFITSAEIKWTNTSAWLQEQTKTHESAS